MFIEFYINGVLYTRSEHEWHQIDPPLTGVEAFLHRESELNSIIEALKKKYSTAISQANRWEFTVIFSSKFPPVS